MSSPQPSLILSPATPPHSAGPMHPTAHPHGADGREGILVGMSKESMEKWTKFAERGGLGVGVALQDNMATHPSDLMFLKSDEIILLKRLNGDGSWWLGSCEGVLGRFASSSVQFPEGMDQPRPHSQSQSQGLVLVSSDSSTPNTASTSSEPPAENSSSSKTTANSTNNSPITTTSIPTDLPTAHDPPALPKKSSKRGTLTISTHPNAPLSHPAPALPDVHSEGQENIPTPTPTRTSFKSAPVTPERPVHADVATRVPPARGMIGLGLGMLADDTDTDSDDQTDSEAGRRGVSPVRIRGRWGGRRASSGSRSSAGSDEDGEEREREMEREREREKEREGKDWGLTTPALSFSRSPSSSMSPEPEPERTSQPHYAHASDEQEQDEEIGFQGIVIAKSAATVERSESLGSVATAADFFVTAPSPPRPVAGSVPMTEEKSQDHDQLVPSILIAEGTPVLLRSPSPTNSGGYSGLPHPSSGKDFTRRGRTDGDTDSGGSTPAAMLETRNTYSVVSRRGSNPFDLDGGSDVDAGSGGSGKGSPVLGAGAEAGRGMKSEESRESVASEEGGDWAGIGWMMGSDDGEEGGSPVKPRVAPSASTGQQEAMVVKPASSPDLLSSPEMDGSPDSRGSGVWEMVTASGPAMVAEAKEDDEVAAGGSNSEVDEEGKRKSRRRSAWFEEMMGQPRIRDRVMVSRDGSIEPGVVEESDQSGQEKQRDSADEDEDDEDEGEGNWDIYDDYARASMSPEAASVSSQQRRSQAAKRASKGRSIRPMGSEATIGPSMEAMPMPRLEMLRNGGEKEGMSRSGSLDSGLETVELESRRTSVMKREAEKVVDEEKAKEETVAEQEREIKRAKTPERDASPGKEGLSGSASSSSCISTNTDQTDQDGSLETPCATPGLNSPEIPSPRVAQGNSRASPEGSRQFDQRPMGKSMVPVSPERPLNTPRLNLNQSPSAGRPSAASNASRLNSVAATRIATGRQGATVHGELLGDLTTARNPVLINFMIGDVRTTRERAAQEQQKLTPPMPSTPVIPRSPTMVASPAEMTGIPAFPRLRQGFFPKLRPRSKSFGSLKLMELPSAMHRTGSSDSLRKAFQEIPKMPKPQRQMSAPHAAGGRPMMTPRQPFAQSQENVSVSSPLRTQPPIQAQAPPQKPMAPPTLRIDTRIGSTPTTPKDQVMAVQDPSTPKLFVSSPQSPAAAESPLQFVASPMAMTPRDIPSPLSHVPPMNPETKSTPKPMERPAPLVLGPALKQTTIPIQPAAPPASKSIPQLRITTPPAENKTAAAPAQTPQPVVPKESRTLSPVVLQQPPSKMPGGPAPPAVAVTAPQPAKPSGRPQTPVLIPASAPSKTQSQPSPISGPGSRPRAFSIAQVGNPGHKSVPGSPSSIPPLPSPSSGSSGRSPISSKDFHKTHLVDGASFSLAGQADEEEYAVKRDVSGDLDEWGFLGVSPVPSVFMAGEKERKNVPKLEQSILAITSKPYSVASAKKLTKIVSESPIPSSIRSKTWSFLLNTPPTLAPGQSYHQLASQASAHPSFRGPHRFTGREVAHLFRSHHVFARGGGRAIPEMLSVYALRHHKAPPVGWDTTWIAAVCLMNGFDVEEAYWLFEGLVDKLRVYFGREEHGLMVEASVVMEVLEKAGEDKLASRIKHIGMSPRSFIPTWLSTMFIPILPYPTVLRIFDLVLSTTPQTLLRIACAVLVLSSRRLLSLKSRADMSVYLNHPPQDELVAPEAVVKGVTALKVKEEGIKKIRARVGPTVAKRQASG